MNSEAAMETALRQLLEAGQDLLLERLVLMAERPIQEPLQIDIPVPDLYAYDSLLQEVSL
jgi:hypothetical protein